MAGEARFGETELAVLGATPLTPDDPERVGRYRLLGVLGVGGMGRVYLATADGRFVAVKVVRPELADNPQFRRRFAHELQAVSRLDAAFTAPLVDAEADATRPWMATEYVPGISLEDAVGPQAALPVQAVWRLAAGAGMALVAIHQAGLIHRDLKPSNVILALDGPKVIDFGVAHAADLSQLTVTGQHVGTPSYMAPEQAKSGAVGPLSDVFALGALLNFAATGRPPFGEGSATEVLFRVVYEPPDLAALLPLDPELHALVERCLGKDPADRPDAAGVVAAVVEARMVPEWPPPLRARIESRAELAGRASPPPGARPADADTRVGDGMGLPRKEAAPAAKPRRRIRLILAATAALVVIAGTATALAVASQHAGTGPRTANLSTLSNGTGTTPASTGQTTTPTPAAPATSAAPSSASAASSSAPAVGGNVPASSPAARQATGHVTPAQLKAPDFAGYCQATGQGSVHLVANNAYGWHCSADNGTGDDAEAVCAWTNGTTRVANRVADFTNPNSWQCWSSNGEVGSLDWNAYCRDKGFSGAQDNGTNDAYTWTCTGSNDALDSQDACKVLYGAAAPISRFQDFYDKNSWQCWG